MDGGCLEPRAALLLTTVAVTAGATCMLCFAVMSDHWEYVGWDRASVERLATAPNLTNVQVVVEWFLDGRVTRISVRSYRRDDYPPKEGPELGSVFLVPMYGGIWTLCLALNGFVIDFGSRHSSYLFDFMKKEFGLNYNNTDNTGQHWTIPLNNYEERRLMKTVGFPDFDCINYLNTNDAKQYEEPRADWQHRMTNLSISCALVCLIILGSSALVGAFGILKHQISAVLVTGVMYLLAATFALFTLAIIHFKRRSGREDDCGARGSNDGVVLGPGGEDYTSLWRPYLAARVFTHAWSLDLGWAALGVCAAASTLWILLAKVMRYTPITTILA